METIPPILTDEETSKKMKAIREELKEGKNLEGTESKVKEKFSGNSEPTDKKSLNDDDKGEDGYTAIHGEDGTITFVYDDEKEAK